jgi:hypothetical protein
MLLAISSIGSVLGKAIILTLLNKIKKIAAYSEVKKQQLKAKSQQLKAKNQPILNLKDNQP